MGCRLTFRRLGLGAAALIAAAQIGCSDPAGGRSPAEVLSVASAGLEGVDRYTFRSRTAVRYEGIELQELESYEGEIAGHAVRMIRGLSDGSAWAADSPETPSSRLAELAGRAAEIGFVEEAPEGCMLLRVKLSGEAAARDIRARLMRQFERAAVRAESGPAADVDGFRRAVADETARSRRELSRMLDGLKAETSVLVTIDRRMMLPLALEETSVLRYEAGGRMRTEERVTRMVLDGFDGRPSAS